MLFGPRDDGLIVDYACLPALGATNLLTRFPPIKELSEKELSEMDSLEREIHERESPEAWPLLVIAGAGLMAEAMLIALGQKSLIRADGIPSAFPRVIVADDRAEAMVKNVRRRHPRIIEIIDIQCAPLHACADFIQKGDEIVYVCLDDEASGVALGLSLQVPSIKPHVTIVQTWTRHSLLEVTAGCVTGNASIEHVGILDAMDDIDNLLGSVTERFAQAIHDYYRAGPHGTVDGSVEWKDLQPHLKDQNRDQAANFQARLNDIHAYIVPSLSVIDHSTFSFTHEQVEEMAKNEHERWMNREKASGYSRGPRGEGRNKKAMTHSDLVPYEELKHEEQEKDRQAVKNIPRVLWRAGYGVVGPSDGSASSDDRFEADFDS
jgi:hypothetical protein